MSLFEWLLHKLWSYQGCLNQRVSWVIGLILYSILYSIFSQSWDLRIWEIWLNLGVLKAAQAEEFRMSWRWQIWYFWIYLQKESRILKFWIPQNADNFIENADWIVDNRSRGVGTVSVKLQALDRISLPLAISWFSALISGSIRDHFKETPGIRLVDITRKQYL